MAHQRLSYFLVFIIVISQIRQPVIALNILGIVSIPLKTHYTAFRLFFQELAIRGHSVTVINNYPDDNPPPNLKFVNISIPVTSTSIPPMIDFELTVYGRLLKLVSFFINVNKGAECVKRVCENLFVNENMKKFRAKGDKYDVIFVEQYISDCDLAYAAAFYDAPIIGITSQTLLPWGYPRLGIPFDFSSNAVYITGAGTNPSISKKIHSYIFNLYTTTLSQFVIHQAIYEVFEKFAPNVKIDIEKIAKVRMKMMFVYQHHSVTGARLLAPSILEIAGIHIQTVKPVHKDIEKFISSAKHGVIYVSFGTNLRANTMSNNKIQHFLAAFKSIPQRVLWKIENSTLIAGNDNVLAKNWFPQLDILCHPNVLAFVSHGGMLSLSEAAHCGIPLLTIPFFGDQFSNSAAARESGLGITISFQDITADTLTTAIRQLTSPMMQKNAKRVSSRWHDRPQHVMDSAIYWTEYVGRHGDAPAALPSTRSTWFEKTLLDVYTVLLAILLTILMVAYLVYRKILDISAILLNYFAIHTKTNNINKNKFV